MEIEIISSYYGAISRITDPTYHISVIGEDGKLLVANWKEMCRRSANNGASGIREMPFWLEKEQDHIFAPYIYIKGKFDLERFNSVYFENLRQMVDIANSYNMKFYFSLYEACNIKERNNLRNFVPWTNNLQGLKNAWFDQDADKYREIWENRILQLFEGKNVGYELCNEPLDANFKHSGFISYQRLINCGIPDEDIIMGVEWNTQGYRDFRIPFLETYGSPWWEKQKLKWFSTLHNLSEKTFEILNAQECNTHRFWLSVDGRQPKPDQSWWKNSLRNFFKAVSAAPFKNKYAFETMHKKDGDDFDDARGISEIVFEVTGSYPPNFNKFRVSQGKIGGGNDPGDRRRLDRNIN